MSHLHDVLHRIVDQLSFPSEGHRDRAHAEVAALPDYVQHPDADQLDAEQPPQTDPTEEN